MSTTLEYVRRYRWWILAGLVIAGTGGMWYLTQGRSPTPGYTTAKVTRGDIDEAVTALGALQPAEYVDVGAQVSGQLQKLYVAIGDSVKPGDLLADIDPRVYAAAVSQAKADLEAATVTVSVQQALIEKIRADLANARAGLVAGQAQTAKAQVAVVDAKRSLDRQTDLLTKGFIAQSDKDAAQTAYDSAVAQLAANRAQDEMLTAAVSSAEAQLKVAEAQLKVAEAQARQKKSVLDQAQANLDRTSVRAPMAGTVVSLIARQGQTLNANQQAPIILRLANLDTMTVWTQVSEADVSKLTPGMSVYFTTLGQPDRRYDGKLRQILPTPEVINNVVLYDALFDVANPDHQLKPQMSAQVFFVLAQAKNALLVPVAALRPATQKRNAQEQPPKAGPASAVTKDQGKTYVVSVLEEGQVKDRPVLVGVMNRVSAQALTGLQEGEDVILGTGAAAQKAGGQGKGQATKQAAPKL